MLKEAKRAIPVTGDEWDEEIARLCEAAAMDLTTRGVILPGTVAFSYTAVTDGVRVDDESTLEDALCVMAICTFVKANLGNPPNRQWLKESYDEQKAQLMITDGYRAFSGAVTT